jgi:hypothetical protein
MQHISELAESLNGYFDCNKAGMICSCKSAIGAYCHESFETALRASFLRDGAARLLRTNGRASVTLFVSAV